VLWFAARLAKKRGLGQGNGIIEVVARQRMGRASSVNIVRIGDTCLVVGATEEQVTLLAEVDAETVDKALGARTPAHVAPGADAPDAELRPAAAARTSTGALAGTVFDRGGWTAFVGQLRDRTVRKS
jgi:flagellar protein FliO/FliZ